MRLIAAVTLALLCTAASAVEVYRWVDPNGVVHYGDQPKHGAAEPVEVREQPLSDPVLAEAARLQESRAAECQRRRSQLESYRKAGVIKETDGLGNTREYSAGEREQLLARTEKQVTEACAGTPPP